MASSSDDFKRCVPIHLSTMDWNNPHHRRSVAASLVQGVYMLEEDRQAERRGSECFAPPWWEFFNFKLIHQVVDDDDDSIFGAIFEYTPSTYSHHRSIDPPRQNAAEFSVPVQHEFTQLTQLHYIVRVLNR